MTIMIAAAALLAAAPPQAADPQWVDLFELPDGAMTWYDPASVVRGDGGIRVRLRARPGRSAPPGPREFNSVEEIDCRRRAARTIMLVADMDNGESITVPMEEEEAEAINPNSPLAALHAIVCPPSEV
ncbi:MAG TPA: surface-adhesin E family protein [Allosphingosinicella sp.]|nr:surface-adhesin E family protein [Allosphingosinicella sp.]